MEFSYYCTYLRVLRGGGWHLNDQQNRHAVFTTDMFISQKFIFCFHLSEITNKIIVE